MRIGLVCPYTWEIPGGVQQHVADLAATLLELGHDVSVLTPCDPGTALPPHVSSVGPTVPVPYNGSVARLAFGVRAATRVRSWIRDGDFDVLHVHEPVAPSLSLLACWVADGPIVATAHTSNPRSRALAVSAAALRAALENVNGRIAVSEAARRTHVAHLGGDAVLIPNGVAIQRYAGATPLPDWPGDGATLGFLGRMDESRKGLPVLLRAFELLAAERPELRLLLAGPGDAARVHARLDPTLRDRVVVLGHVSEPAKIRALASMTVFCAPNLGGESFGMVLTEAMAAGAPIVASDIPAFRGVLADGAAGALFPVGDERALAATAADLLDDPARRQRLSAAARRAARAYDWRGIAADIVGVYETVLPAAVARAGGGG